MLKLKEAATRSQPRRTETASSPHAPAVPDAERRRRTLAPTIYCPPQRVEQCVAEAGQAGRAV